MNKKSKHPINTVSSDMQNRFFLQSELLSNEEKETRRAELIEVLSRLGTLLTLLNTEVNIVDDIPNDFSINPGKSINLGRNILTNSFLTLLILRYCQEWQIWYNAQKNTDYPDTICDLAAEMVTRKFLDLIPQDNKQVIQPIFTDKIHRILNNINDPHREDINGILKVEKNINIDENAREALNLLAMPTEALLIDGGDSRLRVSKNTLLNKYGCRPFPRPEAYTFASSTASSISSLGFEKAEKKRIGLIRKSLLNGAEKTAATFFEDIKSHIKRSLTLPRDCEIILAPSGTDACLEFAGICQAIYEKKEIVHILVASEETGSGVALALEGKHFSDTTANGIRVQKEKLIDGFKEVTVEKISLRNEKGILKDFKLIDTEVLNLIKKTYAEEKQPVLHIMKQSKLGYSAPSDDLLDELHELYGQKLLKIIDNSQLRLERKEIRYYVEKGFVITVTGSKFFTGPPFCGALLIPEAHNNTWSGVRKHLPEGLKDYFYKKSWPMEWPMTGHLNNGTNYGISLRWYASVVEIRRYFQIPDVLRRLGNQKFCNFVGKLIDRSDHLEPLLTQEEIHKIPGESDGRTIFPFYVKLDGDVLTEEKARRLYELLNLDLNTLYNLPQEDKYVGSQLCHIGQPVKIKYKNGKTTGVLRISLGARVASESWALQNVGIFFQMIKEEINQVNKVVQKIEIILKHRKWLDS